MQIDTARHYQIDVKTGRGNIVLERYPEHTPKTVNNFVFLAGEGFYKGSQFFITHAPQPHLNGKHTVFGTVIEGHNVVDAIQKGDALEAVTVRG